MARGSKPSVNTNCVADRYAAPGEKIIEISSDAGGCLISLSVVPAPDGEAGVLRVDVYRADETVKVTSKPA